VSLDARQDNVHISPSVEDSQLDGAPDDTLEVQRNGHHEEKETAIVSKSEKAMHVRDNFGQSTLRGR